MATTRRKTAPKSRSGCSTCKSRHIRCDEIRPSCTQCQKSSRQCLYSAPVGKTAQLKMVMWQPNKLAMRNMSSNPSRTPSEGRAFDFFRAQIAGHLCGMFDSSFWSHDVPRVAQTEPSVRHAIVALAAMAEDTRRVGHQSRGKTNEFSLKQHTQAVTILNKELKSWIEPSPEVILITCALLICFEMFQNNHESALRQMASGIYVCCDWQARNTGREINLYSSRLPGLTAELQRLFRRLMLQTVLFIDTKPQEWQFLKSSFTPPVPLIPSHFQSIDEARYLLDDSMCSMYHQVLTAQHESLTSSRQSDESTAAAIVSVDENPLVKWKQSFTTFMVENGTTLSPREKQAALLLEIQCITGSVLAVAGAYGQEFIFDMFESEFSQIIDLAARFLIVDGSSPNVIDDKSDTSCPSFDMGILPPLYFVASRCRNPELRRRALDLLRRGPRQEGIWHRELLAQIAEYLMSVEEAEVEAGKEIKCSKDIPHTARLSVLNASIHSAHKKVALHCARPAAVEGESPLLLHEWIAY